MLEQAKDWMEQLFRESLGFESSNDSTERE
jgi:hypothetical protein